MNRKTALILPLLLLAGGMAAYLLLTRPGQEAPQDHLTLYGNIDLREVKLSFNGSEHVETLLVQEGDQVIAGQLLATLHSERLQASRNRAAAQVEAQRQLLAALQAGSRPEEIAQAQAQLAAAEADLHAAELTFKRTQSLATRKLAAEETADEARARRDASRAKVDQARASLALIKAGPRMEDIAAAAATLHALEAELQLATQQLQDAELKAPAAGVIRERILEPGDFATPQTPVFTLALTDPVWVRAYVPETQLGQVRPGMHATIRSDSFPDKTYAGWVGYLSPTAEFTPKTVETTELRTRLVYRLRVYACNPNDELRLGMPVTVQLDLTRENTQPASDCPSVHDQP